MKIVGVSVICSQGTSIDQTVKRILDNPIAPSDWDGYWRYKASLPTVSWSKAQQAVLEEFDAGRDREFMLLLTCAKLAMTDSQLEFADPSRVGLFVAVEAPGLTPLAEALLESFKGQNKRAASSQELMERHGPQFYSMQPFVYPALIAGVLGIHGHVGYVGGACAAGLYAVEAARQWLDSGALDYAIVVAGDSPHLSKALWFNKLGTYSRTGVIRSFDKKRDGFILGEGACAWVLTQNHFPHKYYGTYLGGGFFQEGYRQTVSHPSGRYYKQAINHALSVAHLTMQEVGLVVPHGVGTPYSDRMELEAIQSVMQGFNRPITGIKPYIGHTLAASTLLESTIVLSALQDNMMLGTRGFQSSEVDANILAENVPWPREYNRTFLKTVNGFSGYDAAAIFSYEPAHA